MPFVCARLPHTSLNAILPKRDPNRPWPGPHRKMVTLEESATVSEGEGGGVCERSGSIERGVQGGRGEFFYYHPSPSLPELMGYC